ncbi:serine hydrolase domain-containing protein [Lacticaseibacillus mingshuiensis]|uniref:Serine hydrolase domain-containing protein n=1 Tax=Lacticaseibacillus mingshuiensis TaxID=2799574 RepID=A0ABW4CHC6_9LACO|nr:serine hydrolase domain-containing protein [Lacticaseibacillus mingshuiensis]
MAINAMGIVKFSSSSQRPFDTRTSGQRPTIQNSSLSQPENAVQRDLSERLTGSHFNGSAVIVKNGQVIASFAHGIADASTDRRIDQNSTFEIDSVQKSLTAVLVMHQIRAGQLTLESKLAQFFPAIPGSGEISIKNLLSMTSGLRISKAYHPTAYINDVDEGNQLVPFFSYDPAVRGQWHYDGFNYALLAAIISQVSGKQYPELLRSDIMQPLGITNYAFAYDAGNGTKTTGYMRGQDYTIQDFSRPVAVSAAKAHSELGTGQLLLTAHDLAEIECAIADGRLLSHSEKGLLYQSLVTSKVAYGGGLYLSGNFRRAQGYGDGYCAFLRVSPDGQEAVALLTNIQPASNPWLKVADELASRYVYS